MFSKCRLMTHGIPRQRAYLPQPAGRLSAQMFDHTTPICKGSVSLGMSRVSDLGFRFLQEFGISSTQKCVRFEKESIFKKENPERMNQDVWYLV